MDLINRGESLGFTQAAVRTSSGAQMRPDIRDNDRVQFNDPVLAIELWQRCAEFIPRELERGTVVGFDSEFRFYRYDVGQRFNRHKDGVVRRDAKTRSRLLEADIEAMVIEDVSQAGVWLGETVAEIHNAASLDRTC